MKMKTNEDDDLQSRITINVTMDSRSQLTGKKWVQYSKFQQSETMKPIERK